MTYQLGKFLCRTSAIYNVSLYILHRQGISGTTYVSRHRRLRGRNAQPLAENTTEVGAAGAVPQQPAIAGWTREFALFETIMFTLAFDAEDLRDLIVRVMSCSAGVHQVFLELKELVTGVFQGSHFVHSQALELPIKHVDPLDILLVCLHQKRRILHVSQALEKFYFFLKHVVISDDRWSISAERMRDNGVKQVRELLHCLDKRRLVLGSSEGRVVEQSRKVLQSLESTQDSVLAASTEREAVGIIIQMSHGRCEILLVEDEFHQFLGGFGQLGVGHSFVFFLDVAIFGFGITIIIIKNNRTNKPINKQKY